MKTAGREFDRLLGIMGVLRGKKGCPWDKKQTHKSLIPYLIEEAYELIEALKSGKDSEAEEELGDLLLQAVFHAQVGKERGKYNAASVIKKLNSKLISRHPHVFGTKKGVKTAAHVREIWEKEKKSQKKRESVIDGVPVSMPALLRARRLISKAKSAGFKWKSKESVMKKIREELAETAAAAKGEGKKRLREELGDLLLVTAAYAYYSGIDPEDALQAANEKFIRRFKMIEKRLGRGVTEKEMLKMWGGTKKRGRRCC
ncbi:MAG TPA: nucleoside triphosphate pyrophosphohydrolase [bacterium]|nr:nucleoside triphosphate pyrophosphohydrolase [bacterium]